MIRLIDTKECLAHLRELEHRHWCIGNGGCGFMTCTCKELREKYNAAHCICMKNFHEKLAAKENKRAAKAASANAGDFRNAAFQNE
jgi:hypothetical protein